MTNLEKLRILRTVLLTLLWIVAITFAVLLAAHGLRSIWSTPEGGCMVVGGLAGSALAFVAARRAMQAGRRTTATLASIGGTALFAFSGTVLASAYWLTFGGGQPGMAEAFAGLLLGRGFLALMAWIFEEPTCDGAIDHA